MMDDEMIIALYVARDERAIRETDRKYGNYCRSIASQILPDRLDAEEAVNDTWFKAWNSIPPCRPGVLKLYLASIARNLSFSRFRSGNARKRGGGEVVLALDELGECIGGADDPARQVEKQELTQSIQRFLKKCPQREREIFLRRYFFVDSVEMIGQRFGIGQGNVHVILCRVRKKLKAHLQKEGYL